MAMALAAIIGGGFSRLGYGRRIAVMSSLAALTRIIGFVVHGLFWLFIVACVLFLLTLVGGGFRRGRTSGRRTR